MKPMYFVGKILAIAGALYGLWQLNFDFGSVTAKADLGLGFSALGSLFENNATVNRILGLVTGLIGVSYTPDTDQPPTAPKP